MTIDNDIAALASSLRKVFDQADQTDVQRILAFWPLEKSHGRLPEPHGLPVTACLHETVENACATTADLVQQLASLNSHLQWQQTYTVSDLGQSFLDRYGWTILVGPDAPVECKTVLAGILILGPDLEYPLHQHAAEEAYVILSGTASWKTGDTDWQTKVPTSIIHNPPWQWHAMKTDHGQPQVIGFMWNAVAPEKSRFSKLNQAAKVTK